MYDVQPMHVVDGDRDLCKDGERVVLFERTFARSCSNNSPPPRHSYMERVANTAVCVANREDSVRPKKTFANQRKR